MQTQTLIINDLNPINQVNALPVPVRPVIDNILNMLCVRWLIHESKPEQDSFTLKLAFDEDLKIDHKQIFAILHTFGYTANFYRYNAVKRESFYVLKRAKHHLN